MASLALNYKEKYTWNDYVSWSEDEHWEILAGEAFSMSPAPSIRHQQISGEIFRQTANFFSGKKCQVFNAPTDVKLSDENIVKPDIFVVCNKDQIKDTHIDGAPELVIEVLSPSTESKDRHQKLNIYAKFGVKEYWLVNPWPSFIEVLVLNNHKYVIENVFEQDEILYSTIFPELKLDLKSVFDIELSSEEQAINNAKRYPGKKQ